MPGQGEDRPVFNAEHAPESGWQRLSVGVGNADLRSLLELTPLNYLRAWMDRSTILPSSDTSS